LVRNVISFKKNAALGVEKAVNLSKTG